MTYEQCYTNIFVVNCKHLLIIEKNGKDMGQILSLKFLFDGHEYHCLLRVKEKEDRKEYYITIMNGELESRLFGNHIVTEVDGLLSVELPADRELSRLKLLIAEELSKYLNQQMVIHQCKEAV